MTNYESSKQKPLHKKTSQEVLIWRKIAFENVQQFNHQNNTNPLIVPLS